MSIIGEQFEVCSQPLVTANGKRVTRDEHERTLIRINVGLKRDPKSPRRKSPPLRILCCCLIFRFQRNFKVLLQVYEPESMLSNVNRLLEEIFSYRAQNYFVFPSISFFVSLVIARSVTVKI